MVASNSITTRIYESLKDSISDRIQFANPIMIDQARKFGEQHLRYKLEQWKKTGTFYILNNISEYVTLAQLLDSLDNVNHAVSAVGKWIFDSNYKKDLPLNTYSLNLIYYCYDEYESFSIFLEVYNAVSYFNPKSKSKRVQKQFDIIMNIYIYIYIYCIIR